MSLEGLVSKYIVSAEQVLKEMRRSQGPLSLSDESISEVLDYVGDYLEDAKYYKEQGKFETSLTSVAYCEGLLDALRLLGVVKFDWPSKQTREK